MTQFVVGEHVEFQVESNNYPHLVGIYTGEVIEIVYDSDSTFYNIATEIKDMQGETRTHLFRWIPEDHIRSLEDEDRQENGYYSHYEEVEESSADEVMDSRDIFDMLVERIEMCNRGDIRVCYCEDCPLRHFEYEGLTDICDEVLAWKRKREYK